MKKISALILTCVLLISLLLCGCSEHSSDYIINNSSTITIGVLTSTPSDSNTIPADVTSGTSYAVQLANTINIDKSYEIELTAINAVSESEIQEAVASFTAKNVAAVICEGRNKTTTDTIIEAFKEYNNTPLLFIDCYSDSIATSENAFSISIPYLYQASAVVSHLMSEGLSTGAVVCTDDSDYNRNFAKMFTSTFTSNAGGSVTTYYYSGEEANFNAAAISAADYEFIFIIGNTSDSINIHNELATAGVTSSVILSEVADKTALEASEFNNVCFISKFETDDNNYIGTDFINTYAKANNVSTSDVTSAIAYSYDAYMTIYDALKSVNGDQSSIFQTANTTDADSSEDTAIYVSDVVSALNGIKHMGVTDVIAFNEDGLAIPTFVYIDRIDNSSAGMLNRYNYSNEQN